MFSFFKKKKIPKSLFERLQIQLDSSASKLFPENFYNTIEEPIVLEKQLKIIWDESYIASLNKIDDEESDFIKLVIEQTSIEVCQETLKSFKPNQELKDPNLEQLIEYLSSNTQIVAVSSEVAMFLMEDPRFELDSNSEVADFFCLNYFGSINENKIFVDPYLPANIVYFLPNKLLNFKLSLSGDLIKKNIKATINANPNGSLIILKEPKLNSLI